MKAMFTLNITPASAINAVWGSQWYHRRCKRAEKRDKKKASDFWLLPGEIRAPFNIKNVYHLSINTSIEAKAQKTLELLLAQQWNQITYSSI